MPQRQRALDQNRERKGPFAGKTRNIPDRQVSSPHQRADSERAPNLGGPSSFDGVTWVREFDRVLSDWRLGVREATEWVRESLRPSIAFGASDPYSRLRSERYTPGQLATALSGTYVHSPRWMHQFSHIALDETQRYAITDGRAYYEVSWSKGGRFSGLDETERRVLYAIGRIANEHGRHLRACVTLLSFLIDTGWITDAASASPISAWQFEPGNHLAHPFDDARVHPTLDANKWRAATWRAFQRDLAASHKQTSECIRILCAYCGPLVRTCHHDPFVELRAIGLRTEALGRLIKVDARFSGRNVPVLRDHLYRRRTRAFHARRQDALQSTCSARLFGFAIDCDQLSELACDVLCACIRIAQTCATTETGRVALLTTLIVDGYLPPSAIARPT